MKSIFLKLSSFRFGAARRHCPFTSIIHKSIFLLFAVIFFSMHCFLVPVAAAQIQPQFNPIIGSSAYQVQNFVAGLTPDQLQVFYLLSGTQAITYTGFGNYTVSEDLSTVDKVTNWLKEFGEHFYTDLFFGSVGLPSDLAAPLYDSLLGAANYSSGVNSSYSDWVNSVTSSQDSVFVPFSKGLVPGYNQFFALNDGLYNWQNHQSEFAYDFGWVGIPSSVQSTALTTWNEWHNLLRNPIHANAISYPDSIGGCIVDFPQVKYDIFIDTDDKLIGFYNPDLGFSFSLNNYFFYGILTYQGSIISSYCNIQINPYYFINSGINNYVDLVMYFLNSFNDGVKTSRISVSGLTQEYTLDKNMILGSVYVGESWDNKVKLYNVDDLNFNNNPDPYVLQPLQDLLVDIKGLIQDLIDAEVLKQPVFDNLYDLNGQPEPAPATQPLSISVQLPDSGIVVPSGLFGSSKGFIDYLWYMTKPLVQYSHDFLGTMWFDGVDGFDFSGPAPIVFGVITLGLIGGLIVKFLL